MLKKLPVVAALVWSCFAPVAIANPANCDDDMTPDQKFSSDVCASHAGCALVMSIQTSCTAIKSFLRALFPGGKPSGGSLSDRRLEDVMVEVEDRPPPEWASMRRTMYDRASELLKEQSGARDRLNVHYRLAETVLERCAQARQLSTREQTCMDAQKAVDKCNAHRDDWAKRRDAVVAEGNKSPDPKTRESVSRVLPTLTMPPCPYTLPQTFLTPAQALEQWAKEDAAPPAALTRPGRGGANLLNEGARQAEQDERDRPARLAREKAEQERLAAEQRRLEAERAELQRRYERERAEAGERSRTELFQAIQTLTGEIERNRKRKEEQGSASSGEPDFCIPGRGYNAERCGCYHYPSRCQR